MRERFLGFCGVFDSTCSLCRPEIRQICVVYKQKKNEVSTSIPLASADLLPNVALTHDPLTDSLNAHARRGLVDSQAQSVRPVAVQGYIPKISMRRGSSLQLILPAFPRFDTW